MKTIVYNFLGAFSVALLLVMTSCKKDDDNDLTLGKSEMTMSIDGKPWKATLALMMTQVPEEIEEDYYGVALHGLEVGLDEGVDVSDSQGLTLYFAVPKAKFKNPIGVYNFVNEEDDVLDSWAWAMYHTVTNDDVQKAYATIGTEGSIGTLKINSFKTGKQAFFGVTESEGYTQLTGEFSMTLTLVIDGDGEGESTDAPKTIKITNGKFNINSGFNLSDLIGQYSKIKEQIQLK